MKKRIEVKMLSEDLITDRYLNWFNDESVIEFSGGGKKNLTKKSVLDYMQTGIDTGRYYMWGIFMKENNLHIGNIKVGEIDLKNNISDLATIIGDVNYWGKGLATEAIIVGQELAFEKYNFRKLSGTILAGNLGSLKAYKRAGWVEEGLLKDHIEVGDKLHDQILVSRFNPKLYSKA
tara:strand:+ start:226 stop:756 length:531 start_codon:yes stop_codon:yes gene_type:complete